jgi:D-glycero-alpha-D-manno-heptose-7-phosphate kinase
MIVETMAPTRVDLAGGTVDIWPLYLFHRDALTVNLAIDLMARCRVAGRPDGRILLQSRDTGQSAQFDGLDQLRSAANLKLLAKLICFFAPTGGLEMVTDCAAPAGSGLAGSSALNIAVCGALNHFLSAGYTPEALIGIAKNVEAQVIDVPTGDQDYYPATYGGLSAIHLSVTGVTREEISVDLDWLAQHLVLVYSGKLRNSGINNWEVMKRHIDGDDRIFRAFEGIVAAANKMRSALIRGKIEEVESALDLEWVNRRELCEGITTPEIDEIIQTARRYGASAAKICGAGGGGCLLLTVPYRQRQDIEANLRASGVHVLDYRIAPRGLELTASAT